MSGDNIHQLEREDTRQAVEAAQRLLACCYAVIHKTPELAAYDAEERLRCGVSNAVLRSMMTAGGDLATDGVVTVDETTVLNIALGAGQAIGSFLGALPDEMKLGAMMQVGRHMGQAMTQQPAGFATEMAIN